MRQILKRALLITLALSCLVISGQAPAPRRPRGAIPTPRAKLFAAERFQPSAVALKALPDTFGTVPTQLSYWLNDQYGDCVTAEEAFAKACWSVQLGLPELLIPDATVKAWAKANGYLNGADLTSVMDSMASSGFTVNGVNYTDGPYKSVDFTNDTTLCAAIMIGPVKIGVAANQLENVVGTQNGWFGLGFKNDNSEDHCVSLCGFGTVQSLATLLGVTPPSNANLSGRAYLLFTWDTIGVIDQASMIAITGEAWVRNPTTPQQTPPTGTAPQITSASTAACVAGKAVTFQVVASGSPVPTITETGTLPAGLSFASGLLSGTPTATGIFPLTFTASNGMKPDAVQQFMLSVTSQPPPPPNPNPNSVTFPFGLYDVTLTLSPVLVSPPDPVTVSVGQQQITVSATMAGGIHPITVTPSPQH